MRRRHPPLPLRERGWGEGSATSSPLVRAPWRVQASSGRPLAGTFSRRGEGNCMTLIDSHCHLDFPDFAGDLDQVVERARAAGVERMITIGTQVAKAARVAEIAERYDDVFFTVGTHPHEAASEGAADFSAMRQIAAHPKCVGIGEAGLDYHYGYAPAMWPSGCFAARSGSPASSACRSSSTRATPMTISLRF